MGETVPEATAEHVTAMRIYAMLANGTGGIDWAGLPLAAELYGAGDVELLLHLLVAAKTHRPPEHGQPPKD